MTETIEKADVDLAPFEDTDDGNAHHAHIVNPPNNLHLWQAGMEMKDLVFLARMQSVELVALCGYTFVPKRNPEKYPACEKCVAIAGELMRGAGE